MRKCLSTLVLAMLVSSLVPVAAETRPSTIDVLKQTDTEFDFDVRRCRYAETYREMGLGPIGHLLSCNRDAAFCQGYDARLKLTRTQTLMQGASHCDFRYRLEEEAD